MRWIADVIYLLGAVVYVPFLLYEALFRGKNRRGWRQRMGFVPRFDPSRRRIWIHAVSLGEINATRRLAEMLRERCPDVELVFSSTTDTGYARGVQLYGAERVFRFPLDFSWAVTRALRRMRPTMIVLVEQEVWFNLTRLATDRGIPVVVMNGRLTERSARRLARLGPITRAMFSRLAWVGAQDEEIAARFRRLGVSPERVEVTGSLKWDSAEVTDSVPGADALARALGLHTDRPLWVCGSTGPGEETIILDAYRALLDRLAPAEGGANRPVLAIVPRKPERFDEVARLIERSGFSCIRRSRRADGSQARLDESSVVLGDTMGELRKFYERASVVFVGRSLVPMGGSDVMEVAALGKPILVGPYTDNFRLAVVALEEAGALEVVADGSDLRAAVERLLADPAEAAARGERARRVVREHQGA
ncbi:MAG: 3-deoxy-D-manno-octulosonic acid transferase, partial [Planctomycetota bacterium]